MIRIEWDEGAKSFEFDATLTIDVDGTATVTKRKIERGASTADHKRSEQRIVRLTGIVTNTPIVGGTIRQVEGVDLKISAMQFDLPTDRISEAFLTLDALRRASVIVSVDSDHTSIEEGEVTAVSIQRGDATDSATISVVIEEIYLASTSSVVAPPIAAEPRARNRTAAGTDNAQNTDENDRRSRAAALTDRVLEMF